jgi:hypothetical protein
VGSAHRDVYHDISRQLIVMSTNSPPTSPGQLCLRRLDQRSQASASQFAGNTGPASTCRIPARREHTTPGTNVVNVAATAPPDGGFVQHPPRNDRDRRGGVRGALGAVASSTNKGRNMSQMQSINCDDVREIRPSYWNSPLDSDPAEAQRTVRSVPTTRCPTVVRVALYCRCEQVKPTHIHARAGIFTCPLSTP